MSEQAKPVTVRSILRAFWMGYHEARKLGLAVDGWPARGLLNAIEEFNRIKEQPLKWPAHWKRDESKPRPMSEAPRDGTVILVFVSGVQHGQPAYYGAPRGFARGMEFWRYISNDQVATPSLFLGWLPCPTYTGEAVE